MVNLNNINIMTEDKYNELSILNDDELYAVEFGKIPDYTAGISVAANTTYTIPADGFIVVSVNHPDHSPNNLTINSVSVYSAYMTGEYADGTVPPTEYLVGKGDIVLANRALTFYPLRR